MANTEDILKAGWLEKEYTSRSWFKFRARYVVLTTLNLKYYMQQNEAYEESNDARQEIPLLTVNDAAVLDYGVREPEVVHIETPGRTWRFRAPNAAEADQWRQAIFAARNRLSVSRVHFVGVSKAGVRPLSSVKEGNEEDEEDSPNAVDPLDTLWAQYQANEELINALENVTCSSTDKAKYTANLFFESLGQLPHKERGTRAKEMGRALVAWVDFEAGERVGSGYDSCSKVDVITVWIRIALSREFVASCKFEEPNNGSNDDDASSESSNMTHSTIKSRMRNIRVGTIIMPFRADTAECLFISSIIHASSLKYNLLKTLLHTALRPVALIPENYSYPRNMPTEFGFNQPGPPPAGTNHHMGTASHSSFSVHLFGSPDKDKTNPSSPPMRESLGRQSSRFMSIMRNVFTRSSVSHGGNRPASMMMDERPSSVDNTNRPSSAMLASYFYLINSKAAAGQSQEAAAAALHELAMLTPMDLRRLEVRKRLLDLSAALIQRFQEVSQDSFPTALVTIFKTIRDLIIITQQPVQLSSKKEGKSSDSLDKEKDGEPSIEPTDSENELFRSRKRFEYGTYFTSCSALLFLRLICRAIISPDDYGVTKHTTLHGSTSNRASRRMSGSPNATRTKFVDDGTPGGRAAPKEGGDRYFPRALAPMILLAHAVAYEPPEDSSHKRNPRPRELLEGRYAVEIVSLSKNLAKQIPNDAATKCTEAMRNVYLSCESKVVVEAAHIRAEAEEHYLFDFSKPVTRWALAEVAKTVQHIANISCLPKEEMVAFARESMIRQNIGTGKQDKDSYDTYVFTGYENETINVQVEMATQMKLVYEQLGGLGASNW